MKYENIGEATKVCTAIDGLEGDVRNISKITTSISSNETSTLYIARNLHHASSEHANINAVHLDGKSLELFNYELKTFLGRISDIINGSIELKKEQLKTL